GGAFVGCPEGWGRAPDAPAGAPSRGGGGGRGAAPPGRGAGGAGRRPAAPVAAGPAADLAREPGLGAVRSRLVDPDALVDDAARALAGLDGGRPGSGYGRRRRLGRRAVAGQRRSPAPAGGDRLRRRAAAARQRHNLSAALRNARQPRRRGAAAVRPRPVAEDRGGRRRDRLGAASIGDRRRMTHPHYSPGTPTRSVSEGA